MSSKKVDKINDIASNITDNNWKGKYQTQSGFKDVIIDAINAGYNLAKEKFKYKKKQKKNESKKLKIVPLPSGSEIS